MLDDTLADISQIHQEVQLPLDVTFVLQDATANPSFPAQVEFFLKSAWKGKIIRVPEGSRDAALLQQGVYEVGVPLIGAPVRDVFSPVPWSILEASLSYLLPYTRDNFKNPVLSMARIVFAHRLCP